MISIWLPGILKAISFTLISPTVVLPALIPPDNNNLFVAFKLHFETMWAIAEKIDLRGS